MMTRLTATLAVIGLAAVIVCPSVLHGQSSVPAVTSVPAVDSMPAKRESQAPGAMARGAAALAPDEQDSVILARQGFMEGIYQYMDDAEDWIDQADSVPPRALMHEAAHLALMLSSFKQLFPPSTNPESSEFSATFETYALPTIWAEPAVFSARLDEAVAAINALSMAADRSEFTRRLQALQATCDACHEKFRRVYVSPLDLK